MIGFRLFLNVPVIHFLSNVFFQFRSQRQSSESQRLNFDNIALILNTVDVLAGALIVFILCLGFYVTPAVLGGDFNLHTDMQGCLAAGDRR